MGAERGIELAGANEEWVREISSEDENEIHWPTEEKHYSKETVAEIYGQIEAEVKMEVWLTDRIAQNCDYRRFVSQSNGRSRRKRRSRIVELLWFGDKCVALKGDDIVGGIDSRATEILGESVDPALATSTLLTRVRGLKKVK